jgi:hypothetical protein
MKRPPRCFACLVFRFAGRQLRSLPPKGAQASLGAARQEA